ncbi:kinase-like protein [Lentinula raphanica]|uniref:Kinase-like protein n=1 Tax=Lentinula raphanica TaxID=153919 RepID=A0AA38PJ82_9AGAR|nr:kinase-like protein [Lentinula raphanica]KAJ3819429.1 kinase-like protein [Lentinula raphanica]KAJ3843904.1 kinase-like protein [Lentinula raphanica]
MASARQISCQSINLPPDLSSRTEKTRKSIDICAKLITERNGHKEVIGLGLNRPLTIGRNPERSFYVVADSSVSGLHCTIFAVRSPSGGVIVSCQDSSKNGIILNGHRIKKASIILMDGDLLRIPDSLTFTCIHLWKDHIEKVSVFDPTPPPHPARKVCHIGRYVVTSQCLGSGSFATVHLALSMDRRCQVACKSIRTKKGHRDELAQVMKEIRILMGLNHPNINRIYDTQEDQNFIHIFLQLCTGGDLFTYINSFTERNCKMQEDEVKYIMFQLLKGLSYLHDKSISHRDLKPENILLYAPGPYPRVQIADFGLARPKSYQETFNVCGTVSYLPPEGILALDQKHLGYVGLPSDCWSAGIILYIMLGSHPFDFEHPLESCNAWISQCISDSQRGSRRGCSQNYLQTEARLKQRIVKGEVDFHPSLWTNLAKAKVLVNMLLIHDPSERATVYAALENPWITDDLAMLEDAYRSRILAFLSPADKI